MPAYAGMTVFFLDFVPNFNADVYQHSEYRFNLPLFLTNRSETITQCSATATPFMQATTPMYSNTWCFCTFVAT